MKEKTMSNQSERGVAMVLALMVLAMLTIMAMGALVTARRSIDVAGGERANLNAFYVADSGLNRAVSDVLDYYSGTWGGKTANTFTGLHFQVNDINSVTTKDLDVLTQDPDLDEGGDTVAPSPLTRDLAYVLMVTVGSPTLQEWMRLDEAHKILFYTEAQTCRGVIDASGMCQGLYYEVWYVRPPSKRRVIILAMARLNDDDTYSNDSIEAAEEYILKMEFGGICENAILANGNATNKSINGNVEIHGGLTVLCDGVTDPYGVVLGGTAGVYNSYDGGSASSMGDEMRLLVDSLPEDDFGNETLEAEVRIKTCGADLGGSASMGTSTVPMDQVCSDGGVNGGTLGSNVFSGENAIESFNDCGGADAFKFPDLTDSATADSVLADKITPLNAWCTITNATASMGWNMADPTNATPACAVPGACTCTLCWDTTSNTLVSTSSETSGNLYDMSACPSVTLSDVNYTGKATFYYGSNTINITDDVLANNSFPSGDAFGFMTTGDINIDAAPGTKLTGLFYAGGNTNIEKQTAIAGIVLSDTFDTKNVPEFYQVPDLAQQAPAGFDKICGGNERLANGGWRIVF